MENMNGNNLPVLSHPLQLPCGITLPNRLVKAATTEGMADAANNLPNDDLCSLYSAWSRGGTGLIITGNVMIDRRYMECPCNVAMEAADNTASRLPCYTAWSSACRVGGSRAIVQLNHAGRQCPWSVSALPVAPSAVALNLPGFPSWLAPTCPPRPLTLPEIDEVKQRFVAAAKLAVDAGFDGVQIHAAHGYLLSQFLSPLTNVRTDDYGGSAANRRRLLLEVCASVRAAIGPHRIVSLKLNSADFQKGGFTEEESIDVITALHQDKSIAIDFIELSGGSYENAAMMKSKERFERDLQQDRAVASSAKPVPRESTRRREAYFVDFALRVRASLPDVVLMLTGGWRSGIQMELALRNNEVPLIGLARPLIMSPNFSQLLLQSPQLALTSDMLHNVSDAVVLPTYSLRVATPFAALNSTLENLLENLWHGGQMLRISRGQQPDINMNNYAYYFTVGFVRNYIWEPRRNLRKNQMIACVVGAALAALAAWKLGLLHSTHVNSNVTGWWKNVTAAVKKLL